MVYYCNRCSKACSTKQCLERHKNRKFMCIGVEYSVNQHTRNSLKKKNINTQSQKQNTQISHIHKHIYDMPDDDDDSYDIVSSSVKNKNVCRYCSKVFSYKSGLSKHINTLVCKKIPRYEKKGILKTCNNRTVEELRDIHNQNINYNKKIYKHTINNTSSQTNNQTNNNQHANIKNYNNSHNNIHTQNNIQTQNNINITINPFGKENLDSISEKTMMRVLNKAFRAFPAALEEIFFKIPENRNFYLPNKSDRKYISYFDGSRCVYEKKDDFNHNVKNNVMDVLENWFDICKEKFIARRQNLISKMFNEFGEGKLNDSQDEEVEIFLLTYSNDIKELVDVQVDKLRNQRKKHVKLY